MRYLFWNSNMFYPFHPGPQILFLFAPLIILDIVLKLLAAYKAAKNGEKVWFVFLIIVNSVGIIPAVYLIFFAQKIKSKGK